MVLFSLLVVHNSLKKKKIVHNSFSQKSELCTLDYTMLHFFIFIFLSLVETTILAFNRTCVWSHKSQLCKEVQISFLFLSVISHW